MYATVQQRTQASLLTRYQNNTAMFICLGYRAASSKYIKDSDILKLIEIKRDERTIFIWFYDKNCLLCNILLLPTFRFVEFFRDELPAWDETAAATLRLDDVPGGVPRSVHLDQYIDWNRFCQFKWSLQCLLQIYFPITFKRGPCSRVGNLVTFKLFQNKKKLPIYFHLDTSPWW